MFLRTQKVAGRYEVTMRNKDVLRFVQRCNKCAYSRTGGRRGQDVPYAKRMVVDVGNDDEEGSRGGSSRSVHHRSEQTVEIAATISLIM